MIFFEIFESTQGRGFWVVASKLAFQHLTGPGRGLRLLRLNTPSACICDCVRTPPSHRAPLHPTLASSACAASRGRAYARETEPPDTTACERLATFQFFLLPFEGDATGSAVERGFRQSIPSWPTPPPSTRSTRRSCAGCSSWRATADA